MTALRARDLSTGRTVPGKLQCTYQSRSQGTAAVMAIKNTQHTTSAKVITNTWVVVRIWKMSYWPPPTTPCILHFLLSILPRLLLFHFLLFLFLSSSFSAPFLLITSSYSSISFFSSTVFLFSFLLPSSIFIFYSFSSSSSSLFRLFLVIFLRFIRILLLFLHLLLQRILYI